MNSTTPFPKPVKVTKEQAEKLATNTMDAYSADNYRDWTATTRALLQMGLTERETEAVLRSKWARWAGDVWKGGTGQYIPAKALTNFVKKQGYDQVKALTAEHFGSCED